MPNTIIVEGHAKGKYDEGRAAGAIKPGHMLKRDSSLALVVHATAGGFGEMMVAIEDALQGKLITDAYASGDLVRYYQPRSGEKFMARLAAGATAVVKGDLLISSGDGTLKKTTGSPTQLYAVAEESVDNSAGGSEVFIKVRAAG